MTTCYLRHISLDSRHLIDMVILIVDRIVAILGDITGLRLGINGSREIGDDLLRYARCYVMNDEKKAAIL